MCMTHIGLVLHYSCKCKFKDLPLIKGKFKRTLVRVVIVNLNDSKCA